MPQVWPDTSYPSLYWRPIYFKRLRKFGLDAKGKPYYIPYVIQVPNYYSPPYTKRIVKLPVFNQESNLLIKYTVRDFSGYTKSGVDLNYCLIHSLTIKLTNGHENIARYCDYWAREHHAKTLYKNELRKINSMRGGKLMHQLSYFSGSFGGFSSMFHKRID